MPSHAIVVGLVVGTRPSPRSSRDPGDNGPPGTAFVLFPLDQAPSVAAHRNQVVSADDTGGCAKVGFGGMRFTGMASGRLVFVRERDLHPADQLSPDRSHTMRLEPQWVASIFAYGQLLWP